MKSGLQDNWFRISVIKHINAVSFQKLKAIREGEYKESENYKINIIYEGKLKK